MRCTSVVWSAIVLMSALSPAGAAQSAGGAGEGARFAQSPRYPLLPRAVEPLEASVDRSGHSRVTLAVAASQEFDQEVLWQPALVDEATVQHGTHDRLGLEAG